MTPLRILHVAPYSERAWAYGGIPRVLHGLTTAQARAGHRVTVATTDVLDDKVRLSPASGSGRRRRQPWQERVTASLEYRVFPNVSNAAAYRWQFYQPIGFGRFLRRHVHEFDVAHLHACHNLLTATAARILRRAGVPYVVQPNGTALAIERRRAAKILFDALLARGLLRGAAAVIAVSEWERRELQEAGVDARLLHVLPNPVPPAPSLPGRGSFRARLRLADGPLLLFLGALSPRKHPVVLAEAAARLAQPVQLVFAGNDRGEADPTRRAVRRLGLGDRTRFTGLLTDADRYAALADADVVVYASRDEAFGLVALEALQVGTPVVVGSDAGCGEVVAGVGGGRLVPPGDAAALASALDSMLGSLPDWRRKARLAAAAVEARFHPDAVCACLERIYHAALGSPLAS